MINTKKLADILGGSLIGAASPALAGIDGFWSCSFQNMIGETSNTVIAGITGIDTGKSDAFINNAGETVGFSFTDTQSNYQTAYSVNGLMVSETGNCARIWGQ
ncbi:MAG: hypothetical protein Q8O25_12205 [Sulfurisoma sp.]|nr:hypothetical protein [Sulfurisoma sp.]